MTAPVAVLPMYDWPEVRPATDELWSALRNALRAAGIAAPDELDRSVTINQALQKGTLLLGQTCGLPYVQGLCEQATLLGAPDYGVPGCAPGEYRSAIVARIDDPRETLNDFKGSCFAMSSPHSQSGYAAMLHELVPLCDEAPFFSKVVASGGHRASIEMVASGAADIVAIDYVSWRMALKYMPDSARLREVALTTPAPGLPLITSRRKDRDLMLDTVGNGFNSLSRQASEQLGIKGFNTFEHDDYDVIARRFRTAQERVCLS